MSTITEILEAYRNTANDLDTTKDSLEAERLNGKWLEGEVNRLTTLVNENGKVRRDAQEQLRMEKEAHADTREQLQKVRRHRDDLAAKIGKAREELARHDNPDAKAILQLLADAKDEQ